MRTKQKKGTFLDEFLRKFDRAGIPRKNRKSEIITVSDFNCFCREEGCKGELIGPRIEVTEIVCQHMVCIVFITCNRCGRLHDLIGNPSFNSKSMRLFLKKGTDVVIVKNKSNRIVNRFSVYVVGLQKKRRIPHFRSK